MVSSAMKSITPDVIRTSFKVCDIAPYGQDVPLGELNQRLRTIMSFTPNDLISNDDEERMTVDDDLDDDDSSCDDDYLDDGDSSCDDDDLDDNSSCDDDYLDDDDSSCDDDDLDDDSSCDDNYLDDDSSCDDDYFDMNEDMAPANTADLFGETLSHLMEGTDDVNDDILMNEDVNVENKQSNSINDTECNVVDDVCIAHSESGVVEHASQLSNDDDGGDNRVDFNVNKVARVTKRMAALDA